MALDDESEPIQLTAVAESDKTFEDRVAGAFARDGLNTLLLDIRDGVTELKVEVANLNRRVTEARESDYILHQKVDAVSLRQAGIAATVDDIAPLVKTHENERQQRIGQRRLFKRGHAVAAAVVSLAGAVWQWPLIKEWVSKVLRVAPLVVALLVIAAAALAHDHWIRNGKYMDATTGKHCCDESDCKPMSAHDIALVTRLGGDLVVGGVRFTRGQVHKSEDGIWYRCANRCVFTPVEG